MEYLIFIAIPALIWTILRLTLPNQRWEWDWSQAESTFTLLLGHYMRLVQGMVIADVLLAFADARLEVPFAAESCCLAGAIYGLLFLVWLLTHYEYYVHQRYRRDGSAGFSPYTTAQYAMTRTLGYSTVLFTIAGLVWTVVSL
jgi:hypothetical protein